VGVGNGNLYLKGIYIMKYYYNIETVKNHDGSRTGYDAGGRSWRIRGISGNWRAYANVTRQGSMGVFSGCETLAEISECLKSTGMEVQS